MLAYLQVPVFDDLAPELADLLIAVSANLQASVIANRFPVWADFSAPCTG